MERTSKEYLMLFNGISETIAKLETEIVELKKLQIYAEQLFIDSEDDVETNNLIAL